MYKKLVKSVFVFFLLLITGLYTSASAEESSLKEQVIQSAYKALLNKENGLGRYSVIIVKRGTVQFGRPIRTITSYQVFFDGFKKTGEKYLNGEVNGLPVSEERLKELKIGKTREAVTGPIFLSDSLQDIIANFFFDDYINYYSLEGTEIVNNIDTYKLKFVPQDNRKIGEASLFIEKTNFEIVKTVINGKPDNKEIDSVITINYSKSFSDYFMPATIQLEAFGSVQIEGENNSYQYHGEIIFSDYHSF